MLRPRLFGSQAVSIMEVIVGQVGPSAIPNKVRMKSNSAKDRAIPESQERMENRNTVGIRTGRRPMRSETAPKTKPDAAQAIAKADANNPTCAWLR
jgi:predicted lipid-binding transport protein (Tim44 family)